MGNGGKGVEGAAHTAEKSDFYPAKPGRSRTSTVKVRGNRVGGGVTPAVLPHHRTYGSVYGGSWSLLESQNRC